MGKKALFDVMSTIINMLYFEFDTWIEWSWT